VDESDQEGQTTSKEPERADIWPLTLGTLREHRLANSASDPSRPPCCGSRPRTSGWRGSSWLDVGSPASVPW